MSHAASVPAVVLSSHVVGLGIIRALGRMGVSLTAVSYEEHDMGRASMFVTETMRVPHPEKQEEAFVAALLDRADDWGRRILFPADDATLMAVSRNKQALSGPFIVACPDWDVVLRVVDKSYTYRLAQSIGLPVPSTFFPGSKEELMDAAGQLGFPCLLKPAVSHRYQEAFGRKMTKVHDAGELLRGYREATEACIAVMLQELIPGGDDCGAHYNSYFVNGSAVAELTAAKVRMSPPGSGVPRVVVSRDIPSIVEPARRILAALNYCGHSCTEFKRDPRDGVYKLLEVNGRHNRSGALSLRCGINFPWLEYRHLVHGDLPPQNGAETGIYWIDEFHDAARSLRCLFSERYSPMAYIRPYLRPHVFAVFNWPDVKPFFRRCADIISIAFSRLLRPRRQPLRALRPQRDIQD